MVPLKFGVLGYANIAQKAVIPAIQLCKSFILYGIASRNTNNSEDINEKFTCNYYRDYQSLILDKDIDLVYIPLPNALHFKWAKLALENGKHVLVEKSLACTYKEVEELVELAQKNNLGIVENFQFRKHSQFNYIKELLASNEIGDIRVLKSSFGFPAFKDKDNIRYQKDLGGGALLDAGAYTIKMAQEMLGLDVNVVAGFLNYEGNEVDIWGSGMIVSDKNSLQFSFGFDHHYQCSLEVWGSKGTLFTNRIFTAPPGYEPSLTVETADGKRVINLEADNHFVNMLDHLYQCIHNKDKRELEYKFNLNQAKLIEDFKKIAIKIK